MSAFNGELLRRVTLRPYRKGMGPSFTLTLRYSHWAEGRDYLAYRLTMRENGVTRALFEGNDFSPSPLHSIDSDDTVAGILGFLTLRPGDTDPDYFEAYTPEQMAFCEEHAESLSCEAICRFGEG